MLMVFVPQTTVVYDNLDYRTVAPARDDELDQARALERLKASTGLVSG
jgi:hypothetical protein